MRAAVKGIRRRIGTVPTRKAAATVDVLSAMLVHTPQTLAGQRDRALLALGFAGAFRRSELVALDVADLQEDLEGLRVRVASRPRCSGRTRCGPEAQRDRVAFVSSMALRLICSPLP
ncbi:hypothetical protein [Methylobacterium nodulans]|uniref:hypothetical protein n=1 Tax=Methylobacterium nodulans TaxID=114616 RepID=UPI0001619D8D